MKRVLLHEEMLNNGGRLQPEDARQTSESGSCDISRGSSGGRCRNLLKSEAEWIVVDADWRRIDGGSLCCITLAGVSRYFWRKDESFTGSIDELMMKLEEVDGRWVSSTKVHGW